MSISYFYTPFIQIREILRLPGIAQHVPWAYKFVRSLPGMGDSLKKFIDFGMRHALRRFRMEAKEKDLFYYMVFLRPNFTKYSSHYCFLSPVRSIWQQYRVRTSYDHLQRVTRHYCRL